MSMLYPYFKQSLRSLRKGGLFSVLNVTGLAVALSVAFLLLLEVQHERSFDRFYLKGERIYRVLTSFKPEGNEPSSTLANCPNAVAPTMYNKVPGIETAGRLLAHEFGGEASVRAANQNFMEKKLYWADPSIAGIFDLKPLSGNLTDALNKPNSILLSRSVAMRYFGAIAVTGQSIKIDNMPWMEINGVYEDLPENGTLDAALLGSFSTISWANLHLSWSNSSFETWFLLRPEANKESVEKQVNAVLQAEVPADRLGYALSLQPLYDVHLQSSGIESAYSSRLGDPRQVGILAMLAMAVLLIASFNYMNLSTARAQNKFREVGVNKALGAARNQLSLRFFMETGVTVAASVVLAFLLSALLLPVFNNIVEKDFNYSDLGTPQFVGGILGIATLVSFFAGAYPALFLSAFKPRNLLNPTMHRSSGEVFFRRSIVVTQFSLAMVLIMGSLVLYRQLLFIQEKNLGFDAEQVLAVRVAMLKGIENRQALLDQVSALTPVQAATYVQTYPGREGSGRGLLRDEQDTEGLDITTCRSWPGFEKVLNLPIIAGRGLSKIVPTPTDTTSEVILTRNALKYLGLTPEEAIGKKISCQLGPASYIVGIIEDFHSETLHKPLSAYAFHNFPSESTSFLLLKLKTERLRESMQQIESVYSKALPEAAFDWVFLDNHIDKLYRADKRTASVAWIFALLAIFIACLGLFGLAAFTAEQKSKEIGVRKVLGASVSQLTAMLTGQFLKLVFLSIVLAAPFAYYLLHRWLEDFSYHIELEAWMFLSAGLAALLVAGLTVGIQSLKAALLNPVRALRKE